MGEVVELKKPDTLQALKDEFSAAKSPYQRVAALNRYGARHRFSQLAPIASVETGLQYGDDWQQAYHALRQSAHFEIRELQDQLMWAQVDLTLESGHRLLERIEYEKELAHLRSLL